MRYAARLGELHDPVADEALLPKMVKASSSGS
jgi:hypothetical protein